MVSVLKIRLKDDLLKANTSSTRPATAVTLFSCVFIPSKSFAFILSNSS
jgi:hypothetical protein